jgi:hypothetical protein
MNYPFQSTTVMCYRTFCKLKMKKLEHFDLVLTNVPICIQAIARCPLKLWVVNLVLFVKSLHGGN